jgi:membrane associated rhomboid family serine protease
MSNLPPGGPPPTPPPTSVRACYRHPAAAASVVCGRCDQPICTQCMIQAPVGWQCPDCVRQGAKTSRQIQPFSRAGGVGNMMGTNPTPMVLAIIAVNVICFVASGFGSTSVQRRFDLWPNGIYYQHQYYRLFDSMFLHLSVAHIGLNMVTLLLVGPAVEVMLGRSRFLALYLLGGLGGNVLTYLLGPAPQLSLGASGAIFAIMGASVVLARRRRLPMGAVPALIVINLIMDFTGVLGNVDWLAHVGGLVVGAGLALAYEVASHQRARIPTVLLTVGASVITLAVLVALILAIAPGHVNIN